MSGVPAHPDTTPSKARSLAGRVLTNLRFEHLQQAMMEVSTGLVVGELESTRDRGRTTVRIATNTSGADK